MESTSAYSIRRAHVDDAPVLYSFLCFMEEKNFDRSTFEEQFLQNLEHEDYLIQVATEQNIVVGMISAHRQLILHKACWVYTINELFVARSYREKGIEQQLLHDLQQSVADEDGRFLQIFCPPKKTELRKLLETSSFT